jgi:hypothetical protein
MWDFWWTKCHWGMFYFPRISVFFLPIIMILMLDTHLSSEASKIGSFCGSISLPRDAVPPHPKNKNNMIVPWIGYHPLAGMPEIRCSTNAVSGTTIRLRHFSPRKNY